MYYLPVGNKPLPHSSLVFVLAASGSLPVRVEKLSVLTSQKRVVRRSSSRESSSRRSSSSLSYPLGVVPLVLRPSPPPPTLFCPEKNRSLLKRFCAHIRRVAEVGATSAAIDPIRVY